MAQGQQEATNQIKPKDTGTPPPNTVEASRTPTTRVRSFGMMGTICVDPSESETYEKGKNSPPNRDSQAHAQHELGGSK